MADSFTGNLNLRKPEVGHANDTWGGTAGLNSDLDIIDAIFLATGLGTAVGLHVGPAQVLNVEGGITLKDPTDPTKVAVLDRSLITTATTRTFQFPDQDGIFALQNYARALVPTGTVLSGYYGTPPAGFVFADGRTIGDASSAATNRANADCLNLFTYLWPLGFGVVGGRGASAAADWAAHKQLTLPDHSGRTMAGRDNLSGTARGVLGGAASINAWLGQQSVQYATNPATVSGTAHVNGLGITGVALTDGLATSNGSSGSSATPGANGVMANPHFHTVQGNAVVSGNVSGDGWLEGVTAGSTTDVRTNVQPTIAVDVIIAL